MWRLGIGIGDAGVSVWSLGWAVGRRDGGRR